MTTTINIENRAGLSVRWYYNGWQYFTFPNSYRVKENVRTLDTQTSERYSSISQIQKPTKKKYERVIEMGNDMLTPAQYQGLKGVMYAPFVEAYINNVWVEIEVKRKSTVDVATRGEQYVIEIEGKLQDIDAI